MPEEKPVLLLEIKLTLEYLIAKSRQYVRQNKNEWRKISRYVRKKLDGRVSQKITLISSCANLTCRINPLTISIILEYREYTEGVVIGLKTGELNASDEGLLELLGHHYGLLEPAFWKKEVEEYIRREGDKPPKQ